MKTLRPFFILSAGCLLLSTASCRKNDKSEPHEDVPIIYVANPVIDSIVLHKTYPGLLGASDNASVVGRVNGTLLSKNYESGAYVNKGQVLFTIESTKYRDAVQQAQAALATAKSQHDYATRNYQALSEALKSDAVSQIEVIQAKASMEQAAASVKNAEAALSQANLNLSYCTVRAPISGYVSSSIPNVGEYISGEGAPVTLCKIYDNTKMTATFDIEDAQYEQMIGQNGGMDHNLYRNVPIKFNQPLPHSYTADLTYQSPSINSSTGTLQLKGSIKNIDNELKDGMYITVELPYGVNPKAILIKDASIGTDQLGKYVYVVNDSNKVVYTPIKIGELYQDTLRVVNEGLKPGDRYVTEALLTVRNGMTVKPELTK
ncbi:MAG: efflux RND transporter periplasmic adaptor subunit [Muribaculaceae bacterium]|nr:efflux RND transporter periplasmic adaptor subunit [Muribaculaceae bacterium]